MQEIPKGSVDMILCDLPYGVTNCKWDSVISFTELWREYNRVIKENGAIVLFAAQPFTTALIQSNIKQYRYNWYWVKNTVTAALLAKKQPMRCVEDICVFYKKQPTYNPQGLKRLETPVMRQRNEKTPLYRNGIKNVKPQEYTNYPKHILYFDKENGYHPTQKPVDLCEYLIRTYTNEGETVLDNCMGSGSSGVAAIRSGRKFIGMELNNEYFEKATRRINDTTAILTP